MTDAEWDTFLQWMQANTALGRIGHGELQSAFMPGVAGQEASWPVTIKAPPVHAGGLFFKSIACI